MRKPTAIKLDGKIYIRMDEVIKFVKDFEKGLEEDIKDLAYQFAEDSDGKVRDFLKLSKQEIALHRDHTKDLVGGLKNLNVYLNDKMNEVGETED